MRSSDVSGELKFWGVSVHPLSCLFQPQSFLFGRKVVLVQYLKRLVSHSWKARLPAVTHRASATPMLLSYPHRMGRRTHRAGRPRKQAALAANRIGPLTQQLPFGFLYPVPRRSVAIGLLARCWLLLQITLSDRSTAYFQRDAQNPRLKLVSN